MGFDWDDSNRKDFVDITAGWVYVHQVTFPKQDEYSPRNQTELVHNYIPSILKHSTFADFPVSAVDTRLALQLPHFIYRPLIDCWPIAKTSVSR